MKGASCEVWVPGSPPNLSSPKAGPSAKLGLVELKVVTFNIRNGRAQDGPNSWRYRIPLVHSLLASLDADIVAMQEAFKFQIDDIADGLSGYQWAGVGREDGLADGEFVNVFYRTSRLALVSQTAYWFSETPTVPGSISWNHGNTRMCNRFLFSELGSRTEFELHNVHIDHESEMARQKSVRMLVERLTPGVPTIVTGDFNASPSTPEMRYLLDCGVLFDMAPVPDGQGTYHGFTGQAEPYRIDYILATREFSSVEFGWDTRCYGGRYPSDHFPVWARLNLCQ